VRTSNAIGDGVPSIDMTVLITGRTLTLEEVVRVARRREPVRLDPSARERMAQARVVVERVVAAGDAAYGITTGVGVLKRVPLDGRAANDYARRLVRQHRVGQGPSAPPDVVRATLLLQLNAFASSLPGVRPLLAERLVDALAGEPPAVRSLGSVGQADLAPLADLAAAVFAEMELAAGEGLALVTGNPFATAWAALAVVDAGRLLDALDVAAAVSLEGAVANLSILDPVAGRARPSAGLALVLNRFRALLDGSVAWQAPRNLQDPLTFRNAAQVHAAAREVLAHVESVVAGELNASQGNPTVDVDAGRVVSGANFEIVGLAAALDYLRVVLATVLTTAGERAVKLLETSWSGLPTGLAASDDPSDAGLEYLGIAVQALVGEARLLAGPVSFELASSAHAEGIEDRTTLAPLAARRTVDMVGLGRRIAAIELAVASQAVELRRSAATGRGTAMAIRAVREVVPFVGLGDHVPDIEPLVDLVASGRFEPARLIAPDR
jgi:histidine ammonia-lyase